MYLACDKAGDSKPLFKDDNFIEKNFCTDYYLYKARSGGEEKCHNCEHLVLVDMKEEDYEQIK
uniref:Uncharacterized protein n=1 Tax=viral metagenome TaxID=1070528 RepID=A0A6M3JX28_9ZZZZ